MASGGSQTFHLKFEIVVVFDRNAKMESREDAQWKLWGSKARTLLTV